jgi:hypothetical protein
VIVEISKELHVFKDVVESLLLGSSSEEHWSVSAWDGVFLWGRL